MSRSLLGKSFIVNILIGLSGVLISILTARMLGAEGRGLVSQIQLYTSYILMICGASVPTMLIQNSARNTGIKFFDEKFQFTFGLYVTLFASIFLYVAAPYIPNLDAISEFSFYLMLAPIQYIANCNMAIMLGIGRYNSWLVIRAIYFIGWLPFVCLLYYLEWWDVYTYLIGYMVFYLLVSYRGVVSLIYYLKINIYIEYLWENLKSLRDYTVIGSINFNAIRPDMLLITILMPIETLGYYVVSLSIINVINILGNSFSQFLHPIVARNGVSQEVMKNLLATTLSLILFGGLVSLSFETINNILFGEEYEINNISSNSVVIFFTLMQIREQTIESLKGLGLVGYLNSQEVFVFLFIFGCYIMDYFPTSDLSLILNVLTAIYSISLISNVIKLRWNLI